MRSILFSLLLVALVSSTVFAAGQTGVPSPAGKLEMTLYQQADLALVREHRTVTLQQGVNRLGFSWVGGLIDPTSIQLHTMDEVALVGIEFPPETQGYAILELRAPAAGSVPLELVYLSHGVGWEIHYQGHMKTDQTAMSLQPRLKVHNRTAQPLPGVRLRLLVGEVRVLDDVARLAKGTEPYGIPQRDVRTSTAGFTAADMVKNRQRVGRAMELMAAAPAPAVKAAPQSELTFLTIAGEHDLPPHTTIGIPWSGADKVGVDFVYRHDPALLGSKVTGLLSFENTADQGLGRTALPAGSVQILRSVGNSLQWMGANSLPYVPLKATGAIRLAPSDKVRVEPTLQRVATDQFVWQKDRLVGWTRIEQWQFEVANDRSVPVTVEVRRDLGQADWTLENEGAFGAYTKVDADTVQYDLNLPPGGRKTFGYRLMLPKGRRR